MSTLLVINLPPALEEDLIDYLLSQDLVSGFTSYETMGHGSHGPLSIAEQVSGRRKRLQFELLLDDEAAFELIVSGLGSNVGTDIRFWEQPVRNIGST